MAVFFFAQSGALCPMYSQDSFFDLSTLGQIGLLGISAALFVLALLAACTGLRKRGYGIRIAGAFVMFWLFVWLSPQVYYTYYWMIFPDLPVQWVVGPPPGPGKALNMLIFQYRATLSAHGQGILGWCLMIAPFVPELLEKAKGRAG